MQSQIIVTLDGATYAETILPHALFIAQQAQSPLTLLRVIMPPGEPVYPVPYIPDDWYQGEVVWTNNYLTSLASRLQTPGLHVYIDYITGPFAGPAITAYAEQQANVQLIALASHGRDAGGRLLLGSVAEDLFDSAPTSLLLMHPPKDASLPPGLIASATYETVLVPFDGTALDEQVLERAASLARDCHASLQLVAFPTTSLEDEVRIDELEKPFIGEQTHEERKLADVLSARADQLRSSTGLAVKTILIDEDPEQFIERYSEQYEQHMLIVAPRGQKRRSALRFLQQSNAPALLVAVETSA